MNRFSLAIHTVHPELTNLDIREYVKHRVNSSSVGEKVSFLDNLNKLGEKKYFPLLPLCYHAHSSKAIRKSLMLDCHLLSSLGKNL